MANQNKYNVLIIGGGNAGLSFAAQILRKNRGLSVGIIEPSAVHYYQPAWTLVGGGTFDINKTKRQEKDFIPDGADWIKAKADTFQPDDNQVTLADGRPISYDLLMVAPGIQLNWDGIPGLAETIGKNNVTSNYSFEYAPYTWELVQKTKGGRAVFTQPATPIKCGGAPQKIMYLASDYWRKQGVLNNIDVDFYTPGSVIFGVEPFKTGLQKVVKRYGIHTHFKHNMVKIDGPNRKAWFEDRENPDKAPFEIDFDMIHVVPPQSAPDFVKNSPLARPRRRIWLGGCRQVFAPARQIRQRVQHWRCSRHAQRQDRRRCPEASARGRAKRNDRAQRPRPDQPGTIQRLRLLPASDRLRQAHSCGI